MTSNPLLLIISGRFRAFRRDEAAKFQLQTGLKTVAIFLAGASVSLFLLLSLLELNFLFLEASGVEDFNELRDVYFVYVTRHLVPLTPFVVAGLLCLFLLGTYLARLVRRPFERIADYCQQALKGENPSYRPDAFSDLHHMTSFTRIFLHYVEMSQREGRFLQVVVPAEFQGVRRPVFEKVFFFHFVLLFGSISALTGLVIYLGTLEVHSELLDLAFQQFSDDRAVGRFFNSQMELFENMMLFSIAILSTFYMAFGLSLFQQVSAASFGVFATFKAFMQGNYTARVHLIGITHLRPQTRMINRFLRELEGQAENQQAQRAKRLKAV